VTDGNLKATTATTIDSGGSFSPKASTDHTDPKLNGKAFKKSLPSAKKTNKRGMMLTSWFGSQNVMLYPYVNYYLSFSEHSVLLEVLLSELSFSNL